MVQRNILVAEINISGVHMANTLATKSASADAGKAASLFPVPRLDFEAVVASQHKVLEALMEGNKIAIEGFQAVMRHQFEIGRQAMDQFSAMIRDFGQTNGTVEDRLAKQAEFSKQAFEKGLSNARDTAVLVTQAGTEALNVLGKRVTERLDEVRDHAKKRVAAN
jgi:phasin family protein